MNDLNPVIHESGRLVLVSNLYVVDEADFVYLANSTDFSSGKISSHMAKLEAAGYVEITKGFVGKRPRTTYKLTDTGRNEFERYRASIESLFNSDETES